VALYVLDTDTVTFQQTGREAVLHHLAVVPQDSVCTTVITLREQLQGRLAVIDRVAEGPALVLAYERLSTTVRYFSSIYVLPFTSAAGIQLLKLREQKVRIGTQDLRIASIVLSMSGILVTSNRRDYEKVPGLRIEDWNR